MLISNDLYQTPQLSHPIALTIGNFDGIHLGHQAIFHFLRLKASRQGSVAVLTFTNHPSELLNKHTQPMFIYTIEHKLKLFQEIGINLVFLAEFNARFAEKPFDLFLKELKEYLSFSFLVLGERASFGKDRQGNPEAIQALSPLLKFEVNYLPKTFWEGHPISSGRIREAIRKGDLLEASALLGRPYSVFSTLKQHPDYYEISASDLCLPPDGTYPITIRNPPLEGEAHISNSNKKIQVTCSHANRLSTDEPVEIVYTQAVRSL